MASKFAPTLDKGPLPLKPIRQGSQGVLLSCVQRGALSQAPSRTAAAAARLPPPAHRPPSRPSPRCHPATARDSARRALLDALDAIRGRKALGA